MMQHLKLFNSTAQQFIKVLLVMNATFVIFCSEGRTEQNTERDS